MDGKKIVASKADRCVVFSERANCISVKYAPCEKGLIDVTLMFKMDQSNICSIFVCLLILCETKSPKKRGVLILDTRSYRRSA